MFKLLDELGDLDSVAVQMALEFGRPRDEMLSDLMGVCRDLLARDLVEAVPEDGSKPQP